MDMKHTPGPWRLVGDCIEAGGAHRLLPVAVLPRAKGHEAEDAANGALLAAAPELLAALREVLEIALQCIPAEKLIPQEREAFADAQELVDRLPQAAGGQP